MECAQFGPTIAAANFGRTVIDFNDQPELKDDEKYFIHIILEQGTVHVAVSRDKSDSFGIPCTFCMQLAYLRAPGR